MFRLALATLALIAAPALAAPDQPAAAPIAADGGAPAPRMANLIVFGNDPCPRSSSQEIVVCARLPESERYRVPKRFRGKRDANAPAPDTWTNRVGELESVSAVGRPNSCSVVGSNGQTGCFQQFLRQAAEDRRERKAGAAAADVP